MQPSVGCCSNLNVAMFPHDTHSLNLYFAVVCFVGDGLSQSRNCEGVQSEEEKFVLNRELYCRHHDPPDVEGGVGPVEEPPDLPLPGALVAQIRECVGHKPGCKDEDTNISHQSQSGTLGSTFPNPTSEPRRPC